MLDRLLLPRVEHERLTMRLLLLLKLAPELLCTAVLEILLTQAHICGRA